MNILTRIYNRKLLTGVIAALLAVIVIGGAVAATRTVNTTARVEVTVWQNVSNGDLYLSTRPEGGRWTTHQTPLDMSRLSSSGRFRQGSAITVGVPVSVTVAESTEPETTPITQATSTPATTPAPSGQLWLGSGGSTLEWRYSAVQNKVTGKVTTIIYGYRMFFQCSSDKLIVQIRRYGYYQYDTTLSYRIDQGDLRTINLIRSKASIVRTSWRTHYNISGDRWFVDELASASVMSATVGSSSSSWDIDVAGLTATPAWANIVNCAR